MQPCKTGDQPYSDASPNSECSLVQVCIYHDQKMHVYLIQLLNFGNQLLFYLSVWIRVNTDDRTHPKDLDKNGSGLERRDEAHLAHAHSTRLPQYLAGLLSYLILFYFSVNDLKLLNHII